MSSELFNDVFTTGSVVITHAGVPFSFSSIDLYALYFTPFNYTFTGLLNGNTVFTDSGTVTVDVNAIGNIERVSNPNATDVIDALQMTLSNPVPGTNPLGLDNIVVAASGSAIGDPHFTTYNGIHYNYQGIGDFVLTRSTVDQFDVQVRTRPVHDGSSVTIMSEAAATLCNHVVTFDIDAARTGGSFASLDASHSH